MRLKANSWDIADKRVRIRLREGINGSTIVSEYVTLTEGDDVVVSVTGNSGSNTQITASINAPFLFDNGETFDIEIYDMSLRKVSDIPTEATGKVGQGQDFDGVDDYILVSYDSSLVMSDDFCYEVLFKPANLTQSDKYLLNTANRPGIIWEYVDDSVEFYVDSYTGDNPRTGSQIELSDTNWASIVYSYDGSTWAGYKNGSSVFSTSSTFSIASHTGNLAIGASGSASNFVDGLIDEVRISSTARSAAWLAATYSSLWDSLLSYGSEETAPVGEADTNVLFIFSLF
jgi:hypothetical protein